jgi:hypothetical protein
MAKVVSKKPAPKKGTPQKAVKKSKQTAAKPIKYSDKSAGQPQLAPIFKKLVALMEPFAKGSLQKAGGKDGQVSLISKKPAEVAGKQVDETWFCGALVQKGYVGFYFMPAYATPEIKAELAPGLLKCLKGKSCFHIKQVDEQLSEEIKDALKKGYALYKKKGWIS